MKTTLSPHPLRWAAGLLAALLVLGSSLGADAATVRAMDLDEHVASSQSIVRGRVVGSLTRLVEGRPFTDTSIEVLASLKGARKPGEVLRVRQLRGPVGETFLRIPGDAEFRQGEEVIVFLHEDGPEASYLTALSFSKYEVRPEEGTPLVVRELGELGLYLPGAGRGGQVGVTDVPVSLPLFEEAVRDLARERK